MSYLLPRLPWLSQQAVTAHVESSLVCHQLESEPPYQRYIGVPLVSEVRSSTLLLERIPQVLLYEAVAFEGTLQDVQDAQGSYDATPRRMTQQFDHFHRLQRVPKSIVAATFPSSTMELVPSSILLTPAILEDRFGDRTLRSL